MHQGRHHQPRAMRQPRAGLELAEELDVQLEVELEAMLAPHLLVPPLVLSAVST